MARRTAMPRMVTQIGQDYTLWSVPGGIAFGGDTGPTSPVYPSVTAAMLAAEDVTDTADLSTYAVAYLER